MSGNDGHGDLSHFKAQVFIKEWPAPDRRDVGGRYISIKLKPHPSIGFDDADTFDLGKFIACRQAARDAHQNPDGFEAAGSGPTILAVIEAP